VKQLHSLLRRQLDRFFSNLESIPAELQGFIKAVNDAYKQSDGDREMLERSLELSSQELLQANSDMRAVFQVLPDLFFRLDGEGIILDYKAGSKTDFYAPPKSLLGKRIQDIPVPEVAAEFDRAIQRVRLTKSQVSIVYSLQIQHRKVFYEARLLPLVENEIITIIRDITEHKRAEEALRKSEEKFRDIVENTVEWIWEVNAEGKYTYASPVVEKILGYQPEEMLNKHFYDLFHPEDREELKKGAFQAFAQKQLLHDFINRNVHKNGRTVWLSTSGVPILDKQGNLLGYRGADIDVTERKLAEQQERELRQKLEKAERMESLAVLAGGVAHDLNNMLGPMVAYPEMILMDLPDDSPVRDDVLRIEQASKAATSVIQDLLTLARRGRYEMKPTNINDVIREYLDSPSFAQLTEKHPDVTVRIELDQSIKSILGSSSHLSKVFMNLIVNAFDAMPAGGELTIATSQQYLVKLLSGDKVVEPNDYGMCRVRDTGTGIEPKDLSRIFEPYYSTKKMGSSGSGLGLPVVYGVVKDHKGYYDVLSTVGKGTEFVLYFPTIAERIQRSPEVETVKGGTETILIVDDIKEQREIAARLLFSLGYRTATASTGRQAVEYLKQHRVDVVVLDMIMEKDFDGLDTYREIIKVHPEQKAVIVSGFSATDRVVEMQKLGAGKYIRKPYTRAELGKAVREELDRAAEVLLVPHPSGGI
jgi:two-component system cell cycle sensor histidine kinase/response regulator CckA